MSDIRIGDEVYVHGFVDEVRKDVVIIKNADKIIPSAQPERMTNRQWIDFLSAQFDISRTSAKEMLHGMMQWKKRTTSKSCLMGDRRGEKR